MRKIISISAFLLIFGLSQAANAGSRHHHKSYHGKSRGTSIGIVYSGPGFSISFGKPYRHKYKSHYKKKRYYHHGKHFSHRVKPYHERYHSKFKKHKHHAKRYKYRHKPSFTGKFHYKGGYRHKYYRH